MVVSGFADDCGLNGTHTLMPTTMFGCCGWLWQDPDYPGTGIKRVALVLCGGTALEITVDNHDLTASITDVSTSMIPGTYTIAITANPSGHADCTEGDTGMAVITEAACGPCDCPSPFDMNDGGFPTLACNYNDACGVAHMITLIYDTLNKCRWYFPAPSARQGELSWDGTNCRWMMTVGPYGNANLGLAETDVFYLSGSPSDPRGSYTFDPSASVNPGLNVAGIPQCGSPGVPSGGTIS